MNRNEARRLVQMGLDQRREEQNRAAREMRLEEYERDMISACNGNCASAKSIRLMNDTDRVNREQMIARKKAQREQLLKEWERDYKALNSARGYAIGCMGLMLVTVWTPLPWWAAAATVAGTAVLEAAYLFRLYYPM